MPPDSMEKIREVPSTRCWPPAGPPPALFDDADGTSQRESFRRYLTTVVQPLSRLLERELADKLDAPDVGLSFDGLYAHDLQGRATAFPEADRRRAAGTRGAGDFRADRGGGMSSNPAQMNRAPQISQLAKFDEQLEQGLVASAFTLY